MGATVVIGATGDVGQGITAALLDAGRKVVGVARDTGRLDALAARLGRPAALRVLAGDLATDAAAEALRERAVAAAGEIDAVVVAVNGPRKLPGLLPLTTPEFSALVAMDLTAHFTAARAFVPAVRPGGAYLGIGGGSADFILEGGAHMSVAQAGLRMMYRGLHHELREVPVHLMLLTIASVVNAPSNRDAADPVWVTDAEVGAQVVAMLTDADAYSEPVWRIGRRGPGGSPAFSADPLTRVQTLTS